MNAPKILIVGMDEEASGHSRKGALVDIHLKIAPSASVDWCQAFDVAWRNHFYMIKREAHATSDHIIILCVPSELQDKHIPELKKVVATTNGYFAESQRSSELELAELLTRENAQRKQVSDLAKDLKI